MCEEEADIMDQSKLQNKENPQRSSSAEILKESTKFDVRDLYKMDIEKLSVDVKLAWYSNLAYIQVTPRDVTIDFLEMPGVKRDGKDVVEAMRVYMTHVAAQKLVRSLGALLECVYRDGEVEVFSSSMQEAEVTTEARRDVEDGKA